MASGGATCVCVCVFLSCHVAQEEGRLRRAVAVLLCPSNAGAAWTRDASSRRVRRAGKGGGGGGGECARTDRSGCLAADRSQGLRACLQRSDVPN